MSAYRFFLFFLLVSLLSSVGCRLNQRMTEFDWLEQQHGRNWALDEGVRANSPLIIDGKLDVGAEPLKLSTQWEANGESAESHGRGDAISFGFGGGKACPPGAEPPARAAAYGFVIMLPEERPISKIVIYGSGLRNAVVEISTEPGAWARIREIKSGYTSPFVITGFLFYRTRYVRLLINKVKSVEFKGIQEIELYGPEVAGGLAALQRAVADGPEDAVARWNLGRGYLERNQLRDAITELDEAVRLQPNSTDMLVDLGSALQRSGRGKEAIDVFKHALRLNNALPDAHFQLAVIFKTMGKQGRAVAHLKKVVEFDAEYPEAPEMKTVCSIMSNLQRIEYS